MPLIGALGRGGDMKGIGTDVVTVSRIQEILARTPGFAAAVFTEAERAACRASRSPARAFAACFAAKESFLKALGLGIWSGVAMTDIEVVSAGSVHRLALGSSARAALDRAGGAAPRVSLSHGRDMAMAAVVVP